MVEGVNVLLLGGWVDHAFTFVRSFSRRPCIHIFVADCWPNSASRYSRYCEGFQLVPKYDDPGYVSAILAFCERREIDVVLPMHHEDLVQVARQKRAFDAAGIRLPIPSPELVELANDKYEVAQIAAANGFSAPETHLLSEVSLRKVATRPGFPALLKLRRSTGQRGQKKVGSPDELDAGVRYLLREHSADDIIVQQYIPGPVHKTMYTVGLLYDCDHVVKACVPLKKIRSRPYTGGTAICTRAENRADVREMAIGLLQACGDWVGIVDVEIKIAPNGRPFLIEVNPRPWGSIYGCYVAGVDLPVLWTMVALKKDFEAIVEFEEGIYASFLSRDVMLLGDLVKRLFTSERGEAWEVLRTYVHPYLNKGGVTDFAATSDFVLDDIRPFLKNLCRFLFS